MPLDAGLAARRTVHATAIAIGGRGLLIVGPSKSGKSRLALALIAASSRRLPIRLVGDDRVVLAMRAGRLEARPHSRIAGFIECRGLGILCVDHQAVAVVRGMVALGASTIASRDDLPASLPVLTLVEETSAGERRDAVLRWCAGLVPAVVAGRSR